MRVMVLSVLGGLSGLAIGLVYMASGSDPYSTGPSTFLLTAGVLAALLSLAGLVVGVVAGAGRVPGGGRIVFYSLLGGVIGGLITLPFGLIPAVLFAGAAVLVRRGSANSS